MGRALEEALDQGAFGLSTGLEYVPGRYTPASEIVDLARPRGPARRPLRLAHRNEEARLLEAWRRRSRSEGGPACGSRSRTSRRGDSNWAKQGPALDLLESARRDGVAVMADAYPYTAYSTTLTTFMEGWLARAGARRCSALPRPDARARIRREVEAQVRVDPGRWERVVVSRVRTERNRAAAVGRSLVEIGAAWGSTRWTPTCACWRRRRRPCRSSASMSSENVERVLRHALVMVGSDGSSMAAVGEAARSRPHPRSYGTFPRVVGYYVRERRLFDLETAVRKMTSLPADQSASRTAAASRAGRGPTSWCSTRPPCWTPPRSTTRTGTRRGSCTSS